MDGLLAQARFIFTLVVRHLYLLLGQALPLAEREATLFQWELHVELYHSLSLRGSVVLGVPRQIGEVVVHAS